MFTILSDKLNSGQGSCCLYPSNNFFTIKLADQKGAKLDGVNLGILKMSLFNRDFDKTFKLLHDVFH